VIPDVKAIAADLMTSHARDIDHIDVWAHIGQAYDIDVVETNLDASIANEVIDLIGKASIDLTWPDGTTNTELDAARVEIERLTAGLSEALERLTAQQPVIDAATAWRAGLTYSSLPESMALMRAVDLMPGNTESASAPGGTWSATPEPNVDAVRDRHGQRWVRSPYPPGPSLWWQGERGAGRPVTWHTLLGDCGPLTDDTNNTEAVTR
jgi:hypothetical protein